MVSVFIDFLYLKEYNPINTEAVAKSFPVKEVLLEILQNLQENTHPRVSFLLKNRLWDRCFPVNFTKFLRTPYLTEHLRWLLLLKFHFFQEQLEKKYTIYTYILSLNIFVLRHLEMELISDLSKETWTDKGSPPEDPSKIRKYHIMHHCFDKQFGVISVNDSKSVTLILITPNFVLLYLNLILVACSKKNQIPLLFELFY